MILLTICFKVRQEEDTSHSLRIGAATTAAANNIPPEEIQKAGRWKSDKYVGYVRATVPIAGLNPYVKGRFIWGSFAVKTVAGSKGRQLLG